MYELTSLFKEIEIKRDLIVIYDEVVRKNRLIEVRRGACLAIVDIEFFTKL